jgi:hypothetical protein
MKENEEAMTGDSVSRGAGLGEPAIWTALAAEWIRGQLAHQPKGNHENE